MANCLGLCSDVHQPTRMRIYSCCSNSGYNTLEYSGYWIHLGVSSKQLDVRGRHDLPDGKTISTAEFGTAEIQTSNVPLCQSFDIKSQNLLDSQCLHTSWALGLHHHPDERTKCLEKGSSFCDNIYKMIVLLSISPQAKSYSWNIQTIPFYPIKVVE